MEETEREDESERYTNIKSNWTMLNESTQNGQSTGKYISDYLWVEWGVKRGWEITDETQGRFSIKVIRTTGKQQSEQD